MVRLETGGHEFGAQVDIPGSIHTAITSLRSSREKSAIHGRANLILILGLVETGSREKQQISWNKLITGST